MSVTHGTPSAYNSGCHCDLCTDENTRRNLAGRAARIGKEPPVHGASAYRNWGCHCDVCVEGNRLMLKARQEAAGPGVNRRKEWTDRDLALLAERKDNRRYRYTALELAIMLGRSVGSVNSQRSRGGKVNNPSDTAAPLGSIQGS